MISYQGNIGNIISLNIKKKKDEILIVIDWNYKDGWIYGHRKDNKNEKGIFQKIFFKKKVKMKIKVP